jgi:D-alanine-D-alanine ligase
LLPLDHPDALAEHDVVKTAHAVQRALVQAGHAVESVGIGLAPEALLAGVRRFQPDLIFNLYEGPATNGVAEVYVAGLYECLGIPYTGSPVGALWLAKHKHLAKHLFVGAGVRTPAFYTADAAPATHELGWPVIVKPALEDASVGIDQGAVVRTPAELAARIDYLRARYGPTVLVEQFIRGREFNVAMLETPTGEVGFLPISEISFTDPQRWPIVSFDAKWKNDSAESLATPVSFPVLPTELQHAVHDLCRRAYRLVGCRDYARCDVRVNEAGVPYLLEVNPNPCIAPTAGFTGALEEAGRVHANLVVQLVAAAGRRRLSPSSPN